MGIELQASVPYSGTGLLSPHPSFELLDSSSLSMHVLLAGFLPGMYFLFLTGHEDLPH